MNDTAKCAICGEQMPAGEEMFKFHGYSGPCPKAPLSEAGNQAKDNWAGLAATVKGKRTVSMLFDTDEQAVAFVTGIDVDEPPSAD